MSTSETKTRTITLTNRPPVRIREDQWPVIAHGSYSDHDNQYEFQANRKWKADIRVRQHEDGRVIVYGVYDYDTAFQNESGITVKAGEVIEPGADVVAAIREVGDTMIAEVGDTMIAATDEAGHDFRRHILAAVRDCISELPAVEL